MKTATGADLAEFFADDWSEDWFLDYEELEIWNELGECALEPEQEYDLDKFGSICSLSNSFEPFLTKVQFLYWFKKRGRILLQFLVKSEEVTRFRKHVSNFVDGSGNDVLEVTK